MIKKNKIGILLNSDREWDYYRYLIEKFPKNYFTFIINNLCEDINIGIIKKQLIITKSKFFLVSQVLKSQKKFNYLISTGLGPVNQINLFSILVFLYAHSIGLVIKFSGLGVVLKKIFKRTFTAGANTKKITEPKQIETQISKLKIKYPSGMDINTFDETYDRWKNCFNYYFCHSKIDRKVYCKIVNKKFTKIIGYPRYEEKISKIKSIKKLKKEFKINNSKKNLVWMPSALFGSKKEIRADNIKIWFNAVINFCYRNNFNLIIRPHPKLLKDEIRFLINLKKRFKFYIDFKSTRNLLELYAAANLVFVDYGGPVFSSIYLNKKTLLLNLPKNHEYLVFNEFEKKKKLEIVYRDKFYNIDTNKKNFILLDHKKFYKNKKMRNKIFGNKINFAFEIKNFFNQMKSNEK